MKVSVTDFELHLAGFMKQIADTMPTSLHKWIGGAFASLSAQRVEKFLVGIADTNGMIDLDEAKKLVLSGFSSSGDEVVIPFGNDLLSALGVKPIEIRLTRTDAESFFGGF